MSPSHCPLDQAAGRSIVIIEPNKCVAEVHYRIPVILAESNDFEQWEQSESKDAVSLLKPAGADVVQKASVEAREQSA